jgi:hypothetical protein
VNAAVALLIEDNLYGFVIPKSVPPKDVIAATSKIQPYYAVPIRVFSLESFPETQYVFSLK